MFYFILISKSLYLHTRLSSPEVAEISQANKAAKILSVYLNLQTEAYSCLAKFYTKHTYIHTSICRALGI